MRHRVAGYKLCRDAEHRRADRRNLAVALFTHGQITTTLPKAKMVQPFVEKLITAAKKGDLASRRRVIAEMQDRIIVKGDSDPDVKRNRYGEVVDGPRVVKKLFDDIAPVYAERTGGYTRIIKLAGHRLHNRQVLKSGHRIGDGSSLVILQLLSAQDEGPQVAGQTSRRREKANRRMDFAAKLRKAGKAEKSEPVADAPASEGKSEESKSE